MVELLAEQSLVEASPPALSKRPTPKHRFKGHEEAVRDFVFLHDSVHVVSGSLDGTMRKWNCNTGHIVGKPWKGEGGSIRTLALSPDGKTIACGREDGSVQRWKTDGKMIEGVWTGHNNVVRSLSWSPSGSCLASGSFDGTILIRKAESGKVEVGPIETKQGGVRVIAYSPAGDRILSGGWNSTICILDSKTGKIFVGPNKIPGIWVTSVVWSLDGSKFYSASDKFARVFDSSGNELQRFEHDDWVFSVAISPKHNVLACVGWAGIAQLWDTESYQPLSQPFGLGDRNHFVNVCVSFSRDGRYLAYSGDDKIITLWTMKKIAAELGAPASQQGPDTHSQSSSSCLNVDATKPLDGFTEYGHDDPYNNFFQTSQPSLPEPSSDRRQFPHLPSARRLWNGLITSRHLLQTNESIPQERPKRSFFARRSHSNLSMQPSTTTPAQPSPEANAQAGEEAEEREQGVSLVGREEPPADAQTTLPGVPAPPAVFKNKVHSKPWNVLIPARGKAARQAPLKTCVTSPEVVEVYAVRGFQRFVAMKRIHKKRSLVVTSGAPLAAASGLSHAGPTSRGSTTHARTSSQAVPGHPGPSSQGISRHGDHFSQAPEGLSSHTSPSHFVTAYHTNYDSDSDSSIQGSCNKFLDKICFPRGHYHRDS